jgi:hypothetical protein
MPPSSSTTKTDCFVTISSATAGFMVSPWKRSVSYGTSSSQSSLEIRLNIERGRANVFHEH